MVSSKMLSVSEHFYHEIWWEISPPALHICLTSPLHCFSSPPVLCPFQNGIFGSLAYDILTISFETVKTCAQLGRPHWGSLHRSSRPLASAGDTHPAPCPSAQLSTSILMPSALRSAHPMPFYITFSTTHKSL